MTERTCGGCTLCCDLVPVKELGNRAFQGCRHKRSVLHAAGPGCGIYDRRPLECAVWLCGWLKSPELSDDMRPDRVGFVIDDTLDLIKLNGKSDVVVACIWVAPGHEDDWGDDGPAAGAIRALCDRFGGVLWRMPPGDRVEVFMKNPYGAVGRVRTEFIPNGPESYQRQRRIAELMRARGQ